MPKKGLEIFLVVCLLLIMASYVIYLIVTRESVGAEMATNYVAAPTASSETPGTNSSAAATTVPLKLSANDLVAKITVEKKARRLTANFASGKTLVCPVSLGRAPVGDKGKEGDNKTPEGKYYICMKNPKSQFYLSLGFSYPNEKDAKKGLADKNITKKQYDNIVKAISKKICPPWKTPLGGAVCLHGGGAVAGNDWTYGCVALSDENIKILFDHTAMKTPIEIRP